MALKILPVFFRDAPILALLRQSGNTISNVNVLKGRKVTQCEWSRALRLHLKLEERLMRKEMEQIQHPSHQ
jgi:hypothetical protein